MKYVFIVLMVGALVFIGAVLFNGHADVMDWSLGCRMGSFFIWAIVSLILIMTCFLYSPLDRDVEYID